MDPAPSTSAPRRTKLARGFLFLASLLFFTLLALGIAEWRLGAHREKIRRSDRLDPYLVHHDPELGWALTQNWRGHHQHYDFQAQYSTDSEGFRLDPSGRPKRGRKLCVVYGDSFAFGFGVNDDQTFVHLLNTNSNSQAVFINRAVPGYSTDQECLLIERDLPTVRPDVILLVVYVANDIFDNQLPSPLQVNGAKPFFKLEQGQLTLCNTPVSAFAQPSANKPTLSAMVMGVESSQSIVSRLSAQSDLFALLRDRSPFHHDYTSEFTDRFQPGLELFSAIVKRIAAASRAQSASVKLVLLAGRSFFETPAAISGQYQNVLRDRIQSESHGSVPVIDAAKTMLEQHRRDGGDWFFHNDGHLNPIGHQVVAQILANELFSNAKP